MNGAPGVKGKEGSDGPRGPQGKVPKPFHDFCFSKLSCILDKKVLLSNH